MSDPADADAEDGEGSKDAEGDADEGSKDPEVEAGAGEEKSEVDAGESDRDSFYQLMYDSSNESHDEAKVKQMSYLKDEPSESQLTRVSYLPCAKSASKLFFGPQSFYICFRFYYTLFERFLKAWEQSRNIEENANTKKLSTEVLIFFLGNTNFVGERFVE